MLDPRSPMPLYRQLADELAEHIRDGLYAPGARIPSEHQLASQYDLGRPTVRQATEVLVRQRVLERRRGAGTFVAERPPEVDLFSLGGTLESFRKRGLTLRTRWLERIHRCEVGEDADQPFAGRRAFRAARLGSLQKEPVLIETFYFDPSAFPDLDQSPPGPAASLSAHIGSRYNARPSGGRQSFKIELADDSAAEALGLSPGTPLLEVVRTLDFPSAPAAIHTVLTCNTSQLVFSQDLGDLTYA
ncbi:MAG: GntR family transcriptional regulator [Gammaproteobacteria bacterium]|nr:GntR family transcriptional regulator [Gammaproteobacteria bacterium]